MIQVRSSHVYRGPNTWARMPVILQVVDIGELEDKPTNRIPGFYEKLTELIPSLYDHGCSIGRPGGFLQRMREGTWMGHVLEHVALEIQNLAGAEVSRGKTRGLEERGVYNVVFQYQQEDVGLSAAQLALRLLNHLIYDAEPDFDFQRELEDKVIRVAERLAYGPSTASIVSEAERRNIPVIRLDPRRSLVQLGHGCYQKRIWATVTSQTSDIAVDIAGNKELTNRLLQEVGIPVPRAIVVRNVQDAVNAANRVGYPVVIKPLDGNHGRGVCINLKDDEEVRKFYPVAEDESRNGSVVVETFVTGRDYRLLVVNNQLVAVAERVPAHVVGDGVHTIAELVDITNQDPRRGVGHEKVLTRIHVDEQSIETLERQGLTVDDVPEPGAIAWLKRTGNMSTGGTSIDRTDDIHPDNELIARQAAMVVGLDIAGIDFVAPDIAQSVRQAGGAIVEVNAGPGFRMHTHPTEGHPRHVGRAVVDMLFPPGTPTRVPIVAVTGTNGKTTTVRMIAHINQTAGKRVGMTTTDGIYIEGTQILNGDMSGPNSARMVLKNPAINFAVLETARGGIIRSGLGFDRCDIAVVTNISADHLGLGGVETMADLARVKAVVPQSVFRDGITVLNADDEWSGEIAKSARGEIIYFGVDEHNPTMREHLRNRGRAVILRESSQGEVITIIEHRRETSLLHVHQIPATLDGKLRVNTLNAMAAAAAAVGGDVQIDHIRQALRTFTSTFFQTPGRFNQIEVQGRRVIMDYCHNIAGLQSMADFMSRLDASGRVGLIGMPGDRKDADIEAFGQLAATLFDRLVIREDAHLRGREPGAVAELLKAAAMGAGIAEERIEIRTDEIEAVREAIRVSERGDLVVLMVDKPAASWEEVNSLARSVPSVQA